MEASGSLEGLCFGCCCLVGSVLVSFTCFLSFFCFSITDHLTQRYLLPNYYSNNTYLLLINTAGARFLSNVACTASTDYYPLDRVTCILRYIDLFSVLFLNFSVISVPCCLLYLPDFTVKQSASCVVRYRVIVPGS